VPRCKQYFYTMLQIANRRIAGHVLSRGPGPSVSRAQAQRPNGPPTRVGTLTSHAQPSEACSIQIKQSELWRVDFRGISKIDRRKKTIRKNAPLWSMVSYFQKIFSPSAQSPGARQPVLALSEGLDPLSLQGSALSVQAARQLWPLTRLLSIV
jgi:hypothetical protein